MKSRLDDFISTHIQYKWTILFLLGFAFYFCSSAIMAPFWGGNDTWSDLLPVVHYQNSILKEHQLPFYTDQWYGGREQWKNPLWNFFYLPATLAWLTLPLEWATKIIFFFHLVFSLYFGWKLAALYLTNEWQRAMASIIFVSPSLPAYLAGHVEKILSWGWILLGLYFLLNNGFSDKRRGLGGGICLGIIPLTGSNYYTLYGFFLFIPLLLAFRKKITTLHFGLGAMIGLVHLPSVIYLFGLHRANTPLMITKFHINIMSLLSSLTTGFTLPFTWETWGLIGIGVLFLFFKSIWQEIKDERITFFSYYDERKALIVSLFVFLLFTSGLVYRFTHLFDTFRVPARAIVFLALTIFIYCLVSIQSDEKIKTLNLTFYIGVSAVQIVLLSWLIRPIGSAYSYDDPGVMDLIKLLKSDHAHSIWINNPYANNMNIDIALTQWGFQLPNVYYGDMGQSIPIGGKYCGFSFDHLLAEEDGGGAIILQSNIERENFSIPVPVELLKLTGKVRVNGKIYLVYRLQC